MMKKESVCEAVAEIDTKERTHKKEGAVKSQKNTQTFLIMRNDSADESCGKTLHYISYV